MLFTVHSTFLRLRGWVLLSVAVLLAGGVLRAQPHVVLTNTDKTGRKYTTVSGDPLEMRTYKLANGLTVMLSVNRSEPRIQTLIATRAGSSNDPADHTGLAHYLEHMLFKGTNRFGTRDWETEHRYLDEITTLYDTYGATKDAAARAAIYRSIDSVSGIAARYAIPNEYDRMMSAIGAQGTNAFTSQEVTCYVNDIPANQLATWLDVEAERFRAPVLRLFHTELEAVYEEKNISLDNDGSKAYDALMRGLFSALPYGTQTTIGTIEHLKNPSLREIEKFYRQWYVSENMGVILAGDFDPDSAIAMVDRTLGTMPRGSAPVIPPLENPSIQPLAPAVLEVVGTEPAFLLMGWPMPWAAAERECDLLELCDLLLAYKGAGLIDLNLVKSQKVADAGCSPTLMKNRSCHIFSGTPNPDQTLEQVRDLLLEQVEHLKRGDFTDEQLRAVLLNLSVDKMRQLEGNGARANTILDAYVLGTSWEREVEKLDRLKRYTRQDIIQFARTYYDNAYTVVYKREGADPNVAKVEKPPITPVETNRDATSPFVESILSRQPQPIEPRFVDFRRDIDSSGGGAQPVLFSVRNAENSLVTMQIVHPFGRRHDLRLPVAARYAQLAGSKAHDGAAITRTMFASASSFSIDVGEDETTVTVTGPRESLPAALAMVYELLSSPRVDPTVLSTLVDQQRKEREDAKKDKGTTLWGGLWNYARYGARNPFNTRLSDAELRALKPQQLAELLSSLTWTGAITLYYYGPDAPQTVAAAFEANYPVAQRSSSAPRTGGLVRNGVAVPPTRYVFQQQKTPTVYVAYMPDMVQAELVWLYNDVPFDPGLAPAARFFNQYFSGDMSSVVFQTIRESKGLAYGTTGSYNLPSRLDEPGVSMAYIGTQADKLPEAVATMNELLTDLPLNEGAVSIARSSVRNTIASERTVRAGVLAYLRAVRRLGLDHDLNADVYNALERMPVDSLLQFYRGHMARKPYALLVLGARDRLDMKTLRATGRVVEVTPKELFGY